MHATVIGVQCVVESYALFLGALILIGGSLGDLFGRRLIFILGVGVFAIAYAACRIAPNIPLMVLAQSVQGVGAALLVPASLSIIRTFFDEQSRGQAIGTWSGFTAIKTAFGPVLGGWLIEHASWQWTFFINIPIAAAVIAISFWQMPESRSPDATSVDWTATLLATAGLGGVVYAYIESERLGWERPWVFGSLIAGAACLIIFSFVEARVSSPVVPPAVFQSRQRCKFTYIVFVRGDWGVLIVGSVEPHPGAGVLEYRDRRRRAATHPA